MIKNKNKNKNRYLEVDNLYKRVGARKDCNLNTTFNTGTLFNKLESGFKSFKTKNELTIKKI